MRLTGSLTAQKISAKMMTKAEVPSCEIRAISRQVIGSRLRLVVVLRRAVERERAAGADLAEDWVILRTVFWTDWAVFLAAWPVLRAACLRPALTLAEVFCLRPKSVAML